jgi:hypothetical protein
MFEPNTLMCNITLFENELRMANLRSNIVQRIDMVADVLTKALPKKQHNKLITMFGLENFIKWHC